MSGPAPFLVALPRGLTVSGVTTWALRLAQGLAARGRPAGLIVHPAEGAEVAAAIDPRVHVFRLSDAPGIDTCSGDLSPFLPAYRAATETMLRRGSPCILSPNLHGDCYGIAAALSLSHADHLRTLGWQHSDIEYDTRLLAHYEPVLFSFIAVSDAIDHRLRAALPGRRSDIANIPYGVELPPQVTRRPSSTLRLIYSGRLEHQQKRILALVHLSDLLNARGLDHSLTIVGDGPARAELERAAAQRPGRITLLPSAAPEAVGALLDSHDCFILPSRYEGLSISMLEAMARGCIPILARTRSGAAQAVESGYNGLLAEIGPEADEKQTAEALADAIARLRTKNTADLAANARSTISERLSLDHHIDRVATLIDEAAASPPRPWPATRPCAFTAPSPAHGSGSVPPEGPRRLTELLEKLARRPVLIHGAGQHTLQLARIFADAPARIVAFADDNPEQHGRMLWNWPVIAPAHARDTSATDVVISSWMHQDAIYARREIYERQGLCVHRIYAPGRAVEQ
jgi:glycosyltransferase involved in cell wall biosynthesis